jgi:hypothetical protein
MELGEHGERAYIPHAGLRMICIMPRQGIQGAGPTAAAQAKVADVGTRCMREVGWEVGA